MWEDKKFWIIFLSGLSAIIDLYQQNIECMKIQGFCFKNIEFFWIQLISRGTWPFHAILRKW